MNALPQAGSGRYSFVHEDVEREVETKRLCPFCKGCGKVNFKTEGPRVVSYDKCIPCKGDGMITPSQLKMLMPK